jgi:hypothetical protein
MSITPVDHIHGSHIGAAWISEESGLCTAGTERRCYPVSDTVEITPTQASVDVKSLSSHVFDAETPILGDKGVTVKLSYYLQPPATVNTTGATPDTDANAPLRILLRCVFGGESCTAGSTVATGTSESAITVDTGHGERMPAGKLIGVSTDDTYGLELCQVRTRAGDDLALYPSLSGTPATGRTVVSLNCYYPTQTNSRSLSIALASLNSSRQVRARGVTGKMGIKLEKNALAVVDFDLVGATFDGPGSLSLATTRGEDPQASPMTVRNAICWLQATSTTTRVNTPIDALAVELNFGNMHLTSLTGTTEGKRAVHRGENLVDSFAKITATLPDNADVYTWHEAGTELCFGFICKVDTSGGGRRFVALLASQCVIEAKPEPMKGEGQLAKVKVVLRAKVSEQCSGTLDVNDLARAPFVLGLG